jgi:hypothetical protein
MGLASLHGDPWVAPVRADPVGPVEVGEHEVESYLPVAPRRACEEAQNIFRIDPVPDALDPEPRNGLMRLLQWNHLPEAIPERPQVAKPRSI